MRTRNLPPAAWIWVISAISLMGLAAASGCSGEATPTPETGVTHPPQENRSTYTDPAYGFRIGVPKDWVVRAQDVARFARFTPRPLASIFFMNPVMARGDLAGVEPPDLEARVYRAEAADSLRGWLISAGFASSGTVPRPFRNAGVSGLEVCGSTMMAPGCSTFVLQDGLVYQLTPGSLEGQAMVRTFAPPSRR